ncbi:hypothetical protein AVEN_241880-1 [Araneus ventricosus]|uniref:Uncharacterized protein n=1 Tax=Araneus ventricosus TaxID=182803 RepID=A0A4Y2NSJ9_ARAVE|nr:hypothetical protein AVEN_241880-1 [Araneus ventricosus]
MFSIEDCIIQPATPVSSPGSRSSALSTTNCEEKKGEGGRVHFKNPYVNKTSVYKGSKILRAARSQRVKQGRRGQEKKSITYGHSDPLRLLHLFLLPLSETGLPQWFCDFLFRERASGSFPTFLNLYRFSFLAQLS